MAAVSSEVWLTKILVSPHLGHGLLYQHLLHTVPTPIATTPTVLYTWAVIRPGFHVIDYCHTNVFLHQQLWQLCHQKSGSHLGHGSLYQHFLHRVLTPIATTPTVLYTWAVIRPEFHVIDYCHTNSFFTSATVAAMTLAVWFTKTLYHHTQVMVHYISISCILYLHP